MKAIGMGSIVVEMMVKCKIKRIHIKDVLHVPKLQANLLSVSKFLSNGLKMQFNLNEYIVRGLDGEVNAIGLHNDILYKIIFTKVYGANFSSTDLDQSWEKND